MMTNRQPTMLDSMISKTERKIEKFERKKKRLEALRDVYKHVEPADIAIRLKDYLGEEKYDVKDIRLSEFRGEKKEELLIIEFNFTGNEVEQFEKFEFEEEVMDSLISEWDAIRNDVKVFKNTSWMDSKGEFNVNFRYKSID